MSESLTAAVAGHLCLDIIPDLSSTTAEDFRTSFAPGHLIEVGPASLSTGGAVSNTGVGLHKLGVDTVLMGKVGQDVFGQAVRQIIEAHGPHLADGLIIDKNTSTSYTIVISPPGIDRVFLHSPGANDTFSPEDVRFESLANARLFHFGYPPIMQMMYENRGARLAELFRRVKGLGLSTSLDMALPDPSAPGGRADWQAILRITLPYVDVFLPSIEEILFMLRPQEYRRLQETAQGNDILPLITPALLSDVGNELMALGVKIAGLKLGYRGFYLRTAGISSLSALGRACPPQPQAWAGQELWIPCFEADLVGTAGSGDATIAGFLAALLRGLTAEEAITAAVAVGACNVEAADTLSGIRPWDETMRRVASGWEQHDLQIDAPGWEYDRTERLWRHTPAS